MANELSIRRLRCWYGTLLRLYPGRFRDRFALPMEQTFGDLLRERARAGDGLVGLASRMFLEALAGAIRENATVITSERKSLIVIALATASILLVPLIAMQFTDEVAWDLADFVVMGVLAYGAGFTYLLIAQQGRAAPYRLAVGVAVGAALLLVWVNMAVGLIGEPGGPNLMYVGVLAIGLFGAAVARFGPAGMARTLFAMAVAQMLVAVIALAAGLDAARPFPGAVLVANGFFAALWVGSALLFRRSGTLTP